MARYYDKLCHVGGYCSKCPNRLDVFGEHPSLTSLPSSGWLLGCCRECNVRWGARDFARTIKAACKVDRTLRLLPKTAMTLLLEFLDLAPWRLRRSLILEHRFRLKQLEWLSCPQEWYMVDYDTEEEEAEAERYHKPILRTLSERYIRRRTLPLSDTPWLDTDRITNWSFWGECHNLVVRGLHSRVFAEMKVLDAICMYLGPYWRLERDVVEMPVGLLLEDAALPNRPVRCDGHAHAEIYEVVCTYAHATSAGGYLTLEVGQCVLVSYWQGADEWEAGGWCYGRVLCPSRCGWLPQRIITRTHMHAGSCWASDSSSNRTRMHAGSEELL